jgi:hypothetical protein
VNAGQTIRVKIYLGLGRRENGSMGYIAYLHKDQDSDYGVSFPDFPGYSR